MNTLSRVRSACRAVVAQATHVHINHEDIPAYAASLLADLADRPTLDSSCHYIGHGEETVVFILALDAINFGSGYFPHLHKRPGMSGYFIIASSLTDFFTANGPLSAHDLQEITARDCATIFAQDMSDPVIAELMKLFSFVLFVSFVVRQLCVSVRVLAFDHFSLVTDLEWQEKHSFTNGLVR